MFRTSDKTAIIVGVCLALTYSYNIPKTKELNYIKTQELMAATVRLYNANYATPPHVILISQEEMQSSFICYKKIPCFVVGYYSDGGNSVYIDHESINVNTTYGESFIVHEMVHYLQWIARHKDITKREDDAYWIQSQFLIQHGIRNTIYETRPKY